MTGIETAEVRAERADIARAVGDDNLCTRFLRTARRQADETALYSRAQDGWATTSWAEYAERAARAAAGLQDLGVCRGDRVALLLRNRPEFHFFDTGALLAGATPLSLYNSAPAEQLRFALGHCRARVVVCDAEFAERVDSVRPDLPDLRHVVVVGPSGMTGVHSADDLFESEPIDSEAASARVEQDDLATVIYTSGTTGTPKGVMLSQRNVLSGVEMMTRTGQMAMRGVRTISYLPMAHVAERMCTHYQHICTGSAVTTCDNILNIGRYLVEVRPQWWFCAPRMWEKLHAGLEASVARDPQDAARFAEVREIRARLLASGNDSLQREWAAAHAEVIAPKLALLGLDHVELAFTGSAPMPRHVLDYFLYCGIELSDFFGMSETCGLISWSPRNNVPGTSGRRFIGTDLRIASDGEICVHGPQLFRGYLDAPDRTSAVFDADGWFHTGDLGRLDGDGNLTVIGRKKEMIVPSSGHNISPIPVEAALREHPLIGQACVIGEGRPHLVALLVLDPDGLSTWPGRPTLEVAACAANVHATIDRHVKDINQRFASAEQVRAIRILAEPWLPDTELMTPTAKLKRSAIAARYADLVDSMYASPGTPSVQIDRPCCPTTTKRPGARDAADL